ncbi:MAG: hypothetical protein QOI31_2992 [Solirubrobacterales bacterium]|jgi:hypothetical protein|nr:hypothetical protein [Solirubrobacterales bacterium]
MFTAVAGGKRAFASIAIAGALAFGVAACGDDDDEGSEGSESTTEETASAEEVTVTATEYEFDLSATPTADTQSVTFDNQGEKFHVMVWAQLAEGVTVDEAIAAEGEKGTATLVAQTEAAPGESATVDVKEAPGPGPYVMLCPIEDKDGAHYELGQLEEFDIE